MENFWLEGWPDTWRVAHGNLLAWVAIVPESSPSESSQFGESLRLERVICIDWLQTISSRSTVLCWPVSAMLQQDR
jgi:hypothetical protein